MGKELVEFVLTENEIAKRLNFEESVISELSHKYMAITVKGIDDKEGYEAAHAARMDIVHKRTDFTKRSKAFRDKLNEYPKMELKVEKRVLALLAPIEEHLLAQEKIVDDEKARIKAEEDAKEAARIQARVDKLFAFGCSFNGMNYVLPFAPSGYSVPSAILKTCADEQFETICAEFQKLVDAENARIEKEKEDKRIEEERLEKVRKEQEAEAARLNAIAEEQRQKEAKIKAEQDAIEKEKQRIEHEKEIEKARKEAAEKAVKDAEEKRIREENAAKEKAEQERIAAEKKAARQPDKVKILLVAEALDAIMTPDVKTEEGKAFALAMMMSIEKLSQEIRHKAEVL